MNNIASALFDDQETFKDTGVDLNYGYAVVEIHSSSDKINLLRYTSSLARMLSADTKLAVECKLLSGLTLPYPGQDLSRSSGRFDKTELSDVLLNAYRKWSHFE